MFYYQYAMLSALNALTVIVVVPFDASLGKPQKKVLFLVDNTLRPLPPPPSRLNGQNNGYKNNLFFLSGQPLTPPPL